MSRGFLEGVYHECLALEFSARRIPFQSKPALRLTYKDQPLQQAYVPDFICFGKIIIELKVVREIAPEHRAQVLNYLAVTGLQLGLLVNFEAHPKASVHRLARSFGNREPTQIHANSALPAAQPQSIS